MTERNEMVIRSIILMISLVILVNACMPVKQISSIKTDEPQEIAQSVQIMASPEAYYNYLQGFMEEQDGNLKEALKKYEAALSFDENSLFMLSRVATLQAKTGQIESAIESMKKLITVAPRPNPAIFLLAEMYFNAGDYENSVKTFNQLIENEPGSIKVYLNRGIALANLKRLDEAEESISKGISLDPDNPTGYVYLGDIYLEQGKMGKARKYYKKAIARKKNYEQPYLKTAAVYIKEKDYDNAERVYKEILEDVNPYSRDAVGHLMQLYGQDKKFDKAIAVVEKSLEHNPRDFDLLYQISYPAHT